MSLRRIPSNSVLSGGLAVLLWACVGLPTARAQSTTGVSRETTITTATGPQSHGPTQDPFASGNSAISGETGTAAGSRPAGVRGFTRTSDGLPLPAVKVLIHNASDSTDRTTTSGADGTYMVDDLKPGHYQLTAEKEGFTAPPAAMLELGAAQTYNLDLSLGVAPAGACPACQPGFFKRLIKAYADDWKGSGESSPEPKYRGYPAPVSGPPFPFSAWPYGGSVTIGQPWTQAGPLMAAIWGSKHGDEWKRSQIQIYG